MPSSSAYFSSSWFSPLPAAGLARAFPQKSAGLALFFAFGLWLSILFAGIACLSQRGGSRIAAVCAKHWCSLSAVGSSCPLPPASSVVMSAAQSYLAVPDLSSDGLSPTASTCAGSRCSLSFGSHLTSLSLFSHQLSMPRKHTWGPPCMPRSI